jgi:hypothetical protein
MLRYLLPHSSCFCNMHPCILTCSCEVFTSNRMFHVFVRIFFQLFCARCVLILSCSESLYFFARWVSMYTCWDTCYQAVSVTFIHVFLPVFVRFFSTVAVLMLLKHESTLFFTSTHFDVASPFHTIVTLFTRCVSMYKCWDMIPRDWKEWPDEFPCISVQIPASKLFL